MRKSLLIYVFVFLSGIFFYSCKPNDAKLNKAIETALATTNTGAGINTIVKEGVVTLSGVVDSEEAKAAAEKAIQGVKDIKSITNNIEVKVPTPSVEINPDQVLTSTINSAISAAGFKDVAIATKNGEITLTGSVKKADLAKVMKIANEAKPKKVINQLKIK